MISEPSTTPQKVLIIEDSAVVRAFLEDVVNQDDRLTLDASVGSGEEALRVMRDLRPDVISMDIHLPGIDGLETTQRIMEETPTPIVVISSSVNSADLNTSMGALEAGALTVLEKPAGHSADCAHEIATQLYIMSQVKVIRMRRSSQKRQSTISAAGSQTSLPVSAPGKMLGIASSTGGPQALVTLLNGLGPDFDLPILVVQHMTDSFLDGFVSWLDNMCSLNVVKAGTDQVPRPGCVYVAPPGAHMTLRFGRLQLEAGQPVCSQIPSANRLFESIARSLGDRAIGVILTGMGEDGARGLKAICDSGGYTIAENQETAVVYGMPAAADSLGAVKELLPLPAIAPRILELIARRERTPAGLL